MRVAAYLATDQSSARRSRRTRQVISAAYRDTRMVATQKSTVPSDDHRPVDREQVAQRQG